MRRVDVVHYLSATEKSLPVVASIVQDFLDDGYRVRVIDLSGWSTISRAFPPQWVLRVFGHRADPLAFADFLQVRGIEYLSTADLVPSREEIHSDDVADVRQAIESELLTYLRRDTVGHSQHIRRLQSSLTDNAQKTYTSLLRLWSQEPPDLVCIPNGRTSRQKAARKAAERLGRTVRLYENGRAKANAYYLGTTQPHDRLASQQEVASLTKKLSRTEIAKLSDEWLSSRMGKTPGTNQFSGKWETSFALESNERLTAVFFASSFDEFLAFGPMWNIDSWSSQFDAFDRIMSLLEKKDINMVLRLHPNLASKSQKYFRREIHEVRELQHKHPSLRVIWHNSPVNSYELVKASDMVIVERSTIGLEAALLGKPVWATQASQWDQVADIRQILSPGELSASVMTPWVPDPAGAQRFVAYWMIQERPLRFDWSLFASWNPDRPPLSLRVAHLAVKNPLFHKLHMLKLTWSQWRNNQFRAPGSESQTE